MRVLTAAGSVAYPIMLLGLGGLGLSDGPGDAFVLVCAAVVPVVIGRLGGRWALPIFAAAFAADVLLYQVLFWADDPKLEGTDDLPPVIAIVWLVVLLPLVAVGAKWRQRTLKSHARSMGAGYTTSQ